MNIESEQCNLRVQYMNTSPVIIHIHRHEKEYNLKRLIYVAYVNV